MIESGYGLYRIGGNASNDVFVVGSYGAILHFDGITWTIISEGVHDLISETWGSSPSDIYAVGNNAWTGNLILHFDGATWSTMMRDTSGGSLRSISGSASNDIYTVGSTGIVPSENIYHYDGTTWTGVYNARFFLNAVWEISPFDVFAVGFNGLIVHFNGATWSEMPTRISYELYDVFGTSHTDVYAVGLNGLILHYDGIAWSSLPFLTTSYLGGIWGSSASDIFVVGDKRNFGKTILHFDGITWSIMLSDPAGGLTGVWGFAADDVYAVGTESISMGSLYHYDGITWSRMQCIPTEKFQTVWGITPDDLFIATGYGGVLHRTCAAVPFLPYTVFTAVLFLALFGVCIFIFIRLELGYSG